MNAAKNFLYGNNTTADLSIFHVEIVASLKASGKMPDDLEDLFEAVRSPVDNPDGTPRYMINAR